MPGEVRTYVELAAIVALAGVLRCTGLDVQNLWYDELWSLNVAALPLSTLLTAQTGHPPLFHVLEKLVLAATGAEISGRIVSAIAGTVGVLMTFAVGRRLFDARTALIAAFLIAIAPLHLWYSREGRMYAVVMLCALASSWFVQSLATRGDWKAYGGYAATTLAGLFTHFAYAGIVIAQALYIAGGRALRLPGGKLRTVASAAGLAVAIAVAAVLVEVLQTQLGPKRAFGPLPLLYTAFAFVAGFSIGPPAAELRQNDASAALAAYAPELLAVAVLGLAAAFLIFRAVRTRGAAAAYCACWLFGPVAVVATGSVVTGVAFNVRYVIGAMPAFVLLVAAGLASTSSAPRRLLLAAFTLCAAYALYNDRVETRYAREDLRAAAAYIDEHAGPNDRVIVSAFYLREPLAHYLRSERKLYRIVDRPVVSDEQARQVATVQLRPPEGSIWLVLSRSWTDDPRGLLAERLNAPGVADEVREFPGVRLYRFDS